MAKDPAFLFYYQDFLIGVDHMTDEQIGQYIKCLCHQAHRGSIRIEHMKNICKSHDNHNIIKEKFISDGNGEFHNARLRHEVEKRKKYAESRRNNRISDKNDNHMKNICDSHDEHMEYRKENIENRKKNIKDKGNIINNIINYYNNITDSNCKLIESNKAPIRARLNDGYSIEDCKCVIRKKYSEWKNTDMSKYIRIITLFGSKFDSYLNQKVKPNDTQSRGRSSKEL